MKNYFEFQDVQFCYEMEGNQVTVVEDMNGNEPPEVVVQAAQEDLDDTLLIDWEEDDQAIVTGKQSNFSS